MPVITNRAEFEIRKCVKIYKEEDFSSSLTFKSNSIYKPFTNSMKIKTLIVRNGSLVKLLDSHQLCWRYTLPTNY